MGIDLTSLYVFQIIGLNCSFASGQNNATSSNEIPNKQKITVCILCLIHIMIFDISHAKMTGKIINSAAEL